jgi:hypothetical protein
LNIPTVHDIPKLRIFSAIFYGVLSPFFGGENRARASELARAFSAAFYCCGEYFGVANSPSVLTAFSSLPSFLME